MPRVLFSWKALIPNQDITDHHQNKKCFGLEPVSDEKQKICFSTGYVSEELRHSNLPERQGAQWSEPQFGSVVEVTMEESLEQHTMKLCVSLGKTKRSLVKIS